MATNTVTEDTTVIDYTVSWFQAVNNLDYLSLESFSKDIDINVKNEENDTALILACDAENEKLVEWLLNLKPELNTCRRNGDTALTIAASKNNKSIVELLLNAGAYIDTQNNSGDTALRLAGDVNIIRLLISTGACLTIVDCRNISILCSAIYHKNVGKVRLLAEAGIDVDNTLNLVLDKVHRGYYNEEIAAILIEYSKNLDTVQIGIYTVLQYVCMRGYTRLVEIILKKRIIFDKTICLTTSAFGLAVDNKHYDIVAMLLQAGTDSLIEKDNQEETPLDAYIKNIDIPDTVKTVLLAMGIH